MKPALIEALEIRKLLSVTIEVLAPDGTWKSSLGSGDTFPANTPVHVRASQSTLDSHDLLKSQLTWDFGDPSGRYDALPGFNAAHLYESVTSNQSVTVSLTVDDPDLSGLDVGSISIPLTTDTRTPVYVVASGGSSTGSGSTPTSAVTFAHALTLIGNDTELFFHGGDVFSFGSSINLQGLTDVMLESYGTGRATLKWTGTGTNPGIITVNSSSNRIQIDNLAFDSNYTTVTDTNRPRVFMPTGSSEESGKNISIVDCTFDHLESAVEYSDTVGGSDGLLFLGDSDVDGTQSIDKYMMYPDGTSDIVFIGNTSKNNVNGENIRINDFHRVLVYGNSFTTTTNRSKIRLLTGDYAWAAKNSFTGGITGDLGPLNDGDGVAQSSDRSHYYVFDSNYMSTGGVRINHGLLYAVIRNNIMDASSGADADGYELHESAAFPADNIAQYIWIVNNTRRTVDSTSPFLHYYGNMPRAEDWDLLNNLNAGPTTVQTSGHADLNVELDAPKASGETSNKEIFDTVSSNVWNPKTTWNKFRINYSTGTLGTAVPINATSPAQSWNNTSPTSSDIEATITLSPSVGSTSLTSPPVPTSSTGNIGTRSDYARYDFNGNLRPLTGVTAGAIELNPLTTPAAPSSLVASPTSDTSITLTWTNNATNQTGFRVERSANGTTGWTAVGTPTASPFVDTGLNSYTTYYYRVFATNSSGDSTPSNTANTRTLSRYTSQDVGSSAPAGSATVVTEGSDYDVSGGGADISGSSDQFQFLYRQVTGDFDYKVEITSFTASGGINSTAKAGIMARLTLDATSPDVMMAITPTGGNYRFLFRDAPSATSIIAGTGLGAVPSSPWVRLRRQGYVFEGFYSSDGTNWTLAGAVTLTALTSPVYVGMAVTSHDTTKLATAQFRGYNEAAGAFGALTINGQIFPNGTAAGDTFSGSISGSTLTITLDSDFLDALGTHGASAMTFDTSGSNKPSSITIHTNGGTDVAAIADSVSLATVPVALDVNSVTFSGTTYNTSLTLNGDQRLSSLTIGANSVAVFADDGTIASYDIYTQSLAVNGKLDIQDNDIIVDYSGPSSPIGSWNGSAYDGLSGYIQTGRNGGSTPYWDGSSGIVTSQSNATAGNYTSIGIAEASQVLGGSGGMFDSKTVDGTAVLIKYTYGGDANLDGKLSIDDYFLVNGPSGWYNGDFNYDGKVNIDDVGFIDNNIGIQGSPL